MRSLGAGSLDLSGIPPGRVAALARVAASVKAQAIARMPEERRISALVAFARNLEAQAQDDALDLFDALVSDMVSTSKGLDRKKRMRTLKDLDAAALTMLGACAPLLDPTLPDETSLGELRARTFAATGRDELSRAIDIVGTVARPPEEEHREELVRKWNTARSFLPDLLAAVDFRGTEAAAPVLEALEYMRGAGWKGRYLSGVVPLAAVGKGWERMLSGKDATGDGAGKPNGKVERKAYSLGVVEALQDGLKRRDVYVSPASGGRTLGRSSSLAMTGGRHARGS